MIFLRAFGVETYQDSNMSSVDFAENDAQGFADAWGAMSFEVDAEVVLSGVATKTRIDREVSRLKGRVTSQDTVVFYYAGHGFHSNGANRLAGSDTFLDDLNETTVNSSELFNRLADLGAQRVLIFVDACHSGTELGGEARSPITAFSVDELRMFDKAAKAHAIFSSCDVNQRSYPYRAERHGYWTSCLLQALEGNVPEILTGNELLYAVALQGYLANEVPALIRNTSKSIQPQRPRAHMNFDQDFIVADLRNIISARRAVASDLDPIVKDLEFFGVETGQVKELSGFRKGRHKIYEDVTDSTRAWVISIASDEVEELFEKIYQGLHDLLGYEYSELKDERSDDGFLIITPAFDVQAMLEQSEGDPGQYLFVITVGSLREPSIINEDGFLKLFIDYLDTVKLQLSKSIKLQQLVEKLDKAGWGGKYQYKSRTSISFQVPETKVIVTIQSTTILFQSASLASLIDDLPVAVAALTGPQIAILNPPPARALPEDGKK